MVQNLVVTVVELGYIIRRVESVRHEDVQDRTATFLLIEADLSVHVLDGDRAMVVHIWRHGGLQPHLWAYGPQSADGIDLFWIFGLVIVTDKGYVQKVAYNPKILMNLRFFWGFLVITHYGQQPADLIFFWGDLLVWSSSQTRVTSEKSPRIQRS